jgi:hypothetical protein
MRNTVRYGTVPRWEGSGQWVCLYRDWAIPSFLLLNPAELARQRGTDGLEM